MNDHTRKISIDPVFLAVSFFLSLFAGGLTWLYLSSPVPAGFVLLLCTALSYFILTFIKSRIKDDVFTKDPISDITGKEILFITVSSFIMMLFLTMSSPLYPFNYWDDANIYFTMGRGIGHGLVPYRDLYDHKGPLIYIIHFFASLISDNSFTGIYILESVMASVFGIYCLRTVRLYVAPGKEQVFLIPLVLSLSYTVRSFHFGDSAEELCFPLLAIALYYGLRSIRENAIPDTKKTILTGITAGIVFWIKFSLCGLYIGFVIYMIITLLATKRYRELIRSGAAFIAGLIIVTIPVLIYFAANRSLGDLFGVYFYDNLFYLKGTHLPLPYGIPVLGKIILSILNSCMLLKDNVYLFVCVLMAVAVSPFMGKKASSFVMLCMFFTALGALSSAEVVFYYSYILMGLSPLAVVLFAYIVRKISVTLSSKTKLATVIISALMMLAGLSVTMTNKNMYLILSPKEDLPEYKFAKIINETPDPSVLTYDFMDGGFYTFADVDPGCRVFCGTNMLLSIPQLGEEREQMIENKEFDYIITMNENLNNNVYNWDGYELVATEEYLYPQKDGTICADTYNLYRLKGDK